MPLMNILTNEILNRVMTAHSMRFHNQDAQNCIRRSPAAAGAVVNGSSAVTAAAV